MLIETAPSLARSDSGNLVLLLTEIGGVRRILIGIDEISCCLLAEAMKTKRITCRSAHQALADLIKVSSLTLNHIVIYNLDLLDRQYQCKMMLRNILTESTLFTEINSIDAVILATLTDKPIYVDNVVFIKNDEIDKKDQENYFDDKARQDFDQIKSSKNSPKM